MPSQQRGEQTRGRILEAAQWCFARYGYDAAGVAEICRRAQVTKGAFYHHFASKQDLFLELLSRWLAGLDAQFAAARAQATSVPQALLRMAGMVRPVFEAASGQLPIFLEFLSKAVRDPAIWRTTIAPYREYRAFFANLIRAGIAEGSLRPIDPERAAQVLVSLAVGLVLQGVLDPQGADWGQVAEAGIRMLLEGIAKEPMS